MRLDVGFFARPTKEECIWPQSRRKGMQLCNFARREISSSDLVSCKLRPDLFHVNSELAPAGKRIDRKTPGMGEIELQCRIGCVRIQRWLSVIPIAELELRGRKLRVRTQQLSKNPSRGNEAIPISREDKTVGACDLIRRKCSLEPGEH